MISKNADFIGAFRLSTQKGQDGQENGQGRMVSFSDLFAIFASLAKETILGAAGIFDRLPAGCLGCSMEQRKETYDMAAEILIKSGHADQAAIYSNKV